MFYYSISNFTFHILSSSLLHIFPLIFTCYSLSGTIFAAYVSFGVSGKHLLSASVMSAPAALACGKLFYPEIEESHTTASDIKIEKG